MKKELIINVDGEKIGKLNKQEKTDKKYSDGSISVNNGRFLFNEDDSITLYDGIFKFGDKVVIMNQGKEIITIDEKGFTINN